MKDILCLLLSLHTQTQTHTYTEAYKYIYKHSQRTCIQNIHKIPTNQYENDKKWIKDLNRHFIRVYQMGSLI